MNFKRKLIKGVLTAGGFAGYLYLQNTWLQKTYYRISVEALARENEGLKIAHLSDLHLPNTQVDLKKLVSEIKEENPDFIFLTGDQFDAAHPFHMEETVQFLKKLSEISPIYAVHGNHDLKSPLAEYIPDVYRKSGVTLLEDEAYTVMAPDRKPIVIIGAAEPESIIQKQRRDLLKKITIRSDWAGQTRLLLAHHPEYFEKYHQDKTKSPDITFSGHAHGGQIRIPSVGGLFAPGQGRMPKHTSGIHALAEDPSKKLVISRGTGPSHFPFRINNRPEVVFVTLHKK